MNRIRHPIALLCALVCAGAANAQTTDATKGKGPPAFGRLGAEELRVIQGLGHAVLSAHQAATDDPVQAALRNDMRELGAAVDQSLVTAMPRIQVDDGKTTRPNVRDSEDRRPDLRQDSASPDRYAAIRSRLSGARQRAERLRVGTLPLNSGESARTSGLLSKTAGLHDEIAAALDGPAADRGSRLAGLRQRLRSKTLAEILAEREAASREAGEAIPEPTPTITTIVRHR